MSGTSSLQFSFAVGCSTALADGVLCVVKWRGVTVDVDQDPGHRVPQVTDLGAPPTARVGRRREAVRTTDVDALRHVGVGETLAGGDRPVDVVVVDVVTVQRILWVNV